MEKCYIIHINYYCCSFILLRKRDTIIEFIPKQYKSCYINLSVSPHKLIYNLINIILYRFFIHIIFIYLPVISIFIFNKILLSTSKIFNGDNNH